MPKRAIIDYHIKIRPYTTVSNPTRLPTHLLKYATFGYAIPKPNPYNRILFFGRPLKIRQEDY